MNKKYPIIDIHTHIGRLPGVVGEEFTPEDLLYIAEHEGAALMLASSASATTISQQAGTDETLAMVKKYGSQLGGMIWINPHDPNWAADVEKAVTAGFYGIKIHPVLDHYTVDINSLGRVFSAAEQYKLPILTHTDIDGSPMSASCYEPLIQAYPNVKLILAHLRWGAIPLAKRYPNVYLDTTYVEPWIVEIGVDALGADKILFGSDAAEGFEVGRTPGRLRPRRSYADIIEGYGSRGICHAALEKILYQNAKIVFNIE